VYQKLKNDSQEAVALVDGKDSAHLKQLMVLLPSKNVTGDDESTGNLQVSKNLTGYVKLCPLSTEHKPKLTNIIDERPKSRNLIKK
jgi:hypothetical protein